MEPVNKQTADEVIADSQHIKFLLDTNVLLALCNPKSPFYLEVNTALDALNHKKQVWLVISYITLGEFLAHRNLLPVGKKSVTAALQIYGNLEDRFSRILSGGPPLNLSTVTELYKKHAKKRAFSRAGFADFVLLSQVESMKNGRLLTCDKGMSLCGKSVLKNAVYYLPNNSDVKSDFVRLMAEIQNDFKLSNRRSGEVPRASQKTS